MDEVTKQKIAEELVRNHIIHNLCLTVNHALQETPDLLYEAENYIPDKGEEYPQIYEYWAVTEWLAEKLKEKGEVVFELWDFHVWGRQTTGQAIKLDPVIQEIALEK
ncbi:hypothetical protein J7L36_02310 [bacterium]|nr:hypothetical protein [bacterium]